MNRLTSLLAIAGTSVALGGVTGCYASVEPEYAEAEDVPPDITTYPHTVYDGRDVYFVNDRYYYMGPEHHWVYYRNAPSPLVERRATVVRERPYVQQAPVVRQRPYVQQAPVVHERRYEERRVAPAVRAPEPATQVR